MPVPTGTGTSSFSAIACMIIGLFCKNEGFDVAYPGRDGIPNGKLRLRLPSPRHVGKDSTEFVSMAASHLSELFPDPGRALILSEENIPGRMLHFMQGRFFPAAGNSICSFGQSLGHAAKTHFVCRSAV